MPKFDYNHIESLSNTGKWLETKTKYEGGGGGGVIIGDVDVIIVNFNLNGTLFP